MLAMGWLNEYPNDSSCSDRAHNAMRVLSNRASRRGSNESSHVSRRIDKTGTRFEMCNSELSVSDEVVGNSEGSHKLRGVC